WSLSGTEVQIVGGNQLSLRTTSLTELTDVERTELIDALAKQAGVSPSDISRTDVGPTWGAEISRKALEGLIVVLVAITIYIALRFEWKMAVGAQVAMVHDRSEERRVGKECTSGWSQVTSSRRRHTRSDRDWSSDVCSSDLQAGRGESLRHQPDGRRAHVGGRDLPQGARGPDRGAGRHHHLHRPAVRMEDGGGRAGGHGPR